MIHNPLKNQQSKTGLSEVINWLISSFNDRDHGLDLDYDHDHRYDHHHFSEFSCVDSFYFDRPSISWLPLVGRNAGKLTLFGTFLSIFGSLIMS